MTRYQRTGGVYHASTLDLDRDASAAFDIESESVGIEFIYFARYACPNLTIGVSNYENRFVL